MCRWIILTKISFHFYNPGSEEFPVFPPHQDLAQEMPAHNAGIARIELAGQRFGGLFHSVISSLGYLSG